MTSSSTCTGLFLLLVGYDTKIEHIIITQSRIIGDINQSPNNSTNFHPFRCILITDIKKYPLFLVTFEKLIFK
ncbi:hypothetical protein T10_13320 [Trichinella papuae]|uniref:Uncharacterized protein n=1 Tax=Trichinella papuae TaxID=268474 RepID=A0A0V1MPA3_9BILA|nr:hypothetical protein T10_13320 [Trichinella papuae]